MKAYKLKHWKPISSSAPVSLFTCARPGRENNKSGRVPDDLVHKWIKELDLITDTVIVSLLGRKPSGKSEFWFYSFYGASDCDQERDGRPSFQEWLARWHGERSLRLIEHPTVDESIPKETLALIRTDVLNLLSAGTTVILMDSGGEERTGQVCEYMNFEPVAAPSCALLRPR